MVEYRLSLFLTIIWHFEILTRESIGKPKMLKISKMANHRAKRMKIWDSGSYSAYMEGTFVPDSLNLVLSHSVHFAKFLIFKTPLLSQFSSD